MDGETYLFDSLGNKIIENYVRYFPDFADITTWYAIVFILLGLGILLIIDWVGPKKAVKY